MATEALSALQSPSLEGGCGSLGWSLGMGPVWVPTGLTLPSLPPTLGPAAQYHCHGPCLPPQLHRHQPEANPGA